MDIVGVKVADIFLYVSVSIHVFFFAHTATGEQTHHCKTKEEIRNQNSVHL